MLNIFAKHLIRKNAFNASVVWVKQVSKPCKKKKNKLVNKSTSVIAYQKGKNQLLRAMESKYI